ncbi:MAG: 30S ribosomal protein S6e [Candidatus Bilamarchaeaceae archaeon]
MQLIISDPKTGKSYKVDIPKDKEIEIIGKKIGDEVELGFLGAPGYKIELTGGSDGSGFPMRKDIRGTGRKSTLLTKGVGFRAKEKGKRVRKTVRGNTFSSEIVQVNSKVKEYGATPLEEIFKMPEKKEEKK